MVNPWAPRLWVCLGRTPWCTSLQRPFLFTLARIPLHKPVRCAEGGVEAWDLHTRVVWSPQQAFRSCPAGDLALEVRGRRPLAANPTEALGPWRPLLPPLLPSTGTLWPREGRKLAQSRTVESGSPGVSLHLPETGTHTYTHTHTCARRTYFACSLFAKQNHSNIRISATSAAGRG